MIKGLVNFSWNYIENYSEEEITYFLSLEGKTVDAICKIRNLDKNTVQRHLIEGKIKYRFLAKAKDTSELFKSICTAGKRDKVSTLLDLDEETRSGLFEYIKSNYGDMMPKDKECAIWILGELKYADGIKIVMKALVHKHVNIRRMAASAMGKIGSIDAESALIRTLEDENPQVVMYAIKSLIKIKSIKAYDKILYLSNNAEKEYIKRTAAEYIESIGNIR